MRTIVDLPEEQLGALSKLCSMYNISRAEAVRRAVDVLIKEAAKADDNVGFGAWKHKRISASAHVESIRNEWSNE
jgi:hypothetical protein